MCVSGCGYMDPHSRHYNTSVARRKEKFVNKWGGIAQNPVCSGGLSCAILGKNPGLRAAGPWRLYFYRIAVCQDNALPVSSPDGPPSRAGRTVRGTVRSNPKRSHLDSSRLFPKKPGENARGFPPGPPVYRRSLRLDILLSGGAAPVLMWCGFFGSPTHRS